MPIPMDPHLMRPVNLDQVLSQMTDALMPASERIHPLLLPTITCRNYT